MLELIEAKNIDGLMFFIIIRISIVLVCWLFMIFACLVDFWSGVTTAKALGEKLISHGFRRTIIKVGDYVKILLFALMFDMLGSFLSFYKIPFATILCTIAVMLIEGRSVIENSKRKKAHAADVPDIIKQIVQAVTVEQGHEVIEKIIKDVKSHETTRN
jgi:hypothetical protein